MNHFRVADFDDSNGWNCHTGDKESKKANAKVFSVKITNTGKKLRLLKRKTVQTKNKR